ncbi:MAG: diguanylate cyclase [Chitinivibrionales bacterium]|nr:diguanylate cyclase [Chitinivibrionales bacterium]
MEVINGRYRVIDSKILDSGQALFSVRDSKMDDAAMQLRLLSSETATPKTVDYFRKQFSNLSSIQHPGVAELYNFSAVTSLDGRRVASKQYLLTYEQPPLNSVLLRDVAHQLSIDQVTDCLVNVLKTVGHLHNRGIVYGHLDFAAISCMKSDAVTEVKLNAVVMDNFYFQSIFKEFPATTLVRLPDNFKNPELPLAQDVYAFAVIALYLLSRSDFQTDTLQTVVEKAAAQQLALLPLLKKLIDPKEYSAYPGVYEIITEINKLTAKNYACFNREVSQKVSYKTCQIGRDKELADVRGLIESSLLRNATKCMILFKGESGVGKTRLLDEITFHGEIDGMSIFLASGIENEIKNFYGIAQILGAVVVKAPLELVKKYGQELVKITGVVNEILPGMKPSPALPAGREAIRLKQRVADFLFEFCRGEQSLILLDDMQWFDQASFDILDAVLTSSKKASLFFIGARRTDVSYQGYLKEYLERWKAGQTLYELDLVRFDYENTAEYVRNLLCMQKAPPRFSKDIFESTEGNPRFIRDTINALVLEGKLFIGKDGNWSSDYDDNHDYTSMVFLQSIDEAAARRYSLLQEEEKELLFFISLFKSPLPLKLLTALSGINPDALSQSLEYLVSNFLVEQKMTPAGSVYSISSKSIKEKAYLYKDQAARIEIHRKAAAALIDFCREKVCTFKDEIINQSIKGEANELAMDFIVEYVNELRETFAYDYAIKLLLKAQEIASTESIFRNRLARICRLISQLYLITGELEKATGCIDEAAKASSGLNDSILDIDIINSSIDIEVRKGNFETVDRLSAQSMELSLRTGYTQGYLSGLAHRGICLYFCRRHTEFVDLIDREEYGLKQDPALYPREFLRLYITLGNCYLSLENATKALEYYTKALEITQRYLQPGDALKPLSGIAIVYMMLKKDFAAGYPYIQKTCEIARELNHIDELSIALYNGGCANLDMDRIEESTNLFMKVYALSCENGITRFEMASASMLCMNHLLMGDLAKCQQFVKISETFFTNEYRFSTEFITLYYNCGQYYYFTGQFSSAAQIFIEGFNREKNPEKIIFKQERILQLLIKAEIESDLAPHLILEAIKGPNEINTEQASDVYVFAADALLRNGYEIEAELFIAEALESLRHDSFCRIKTVLTMMMSSIHNDDSQIASVQETMEAFQIPYYRYLFWFYRGKLAQRQERWTLALQYLRNAVKALYALAATAPQELQYQFLQSCGRPLARQAILAIQLQTMQLTIEKQHLLIQEALLDSHHPLDTYFIPSLMDESIGGSAATLSAENNSLLSGLSYTFTKNFTLILNHGLSACAATDGFVVGVSEDGGLETICEVNRSKAHYSDYIIGHVKQKAEGVYLAEYLGNRRGEQSLFLPKDTTAVICTPLFASAITVEEPAVQDERRKARNRNSGEEAVEILGYLYLSTNLAPEKFTDEALIFMNKLSIFASVVLENYRLGTVSSRDRLTGAYNRKYFENFFDRLIRTSEKNGEPFSVVMVDIDKFKSVNDTYGHQKGDEILKGVVSIIMEKYRKTDICCRYGGEEFVILLPNTSLAEAAIVVERFRSSVEQARLLGDERPVTISLGFSVYPQQGKLKDDLISKADQALYHAKENGRNRFFVWDAKISKTTVKMDRLAGIVTGNLVKDQENVIALLDILEKKKRENDARNRIEFYLDKTIDVLKAGKAFWIELTADGLYQVTSRNAADQSSLGEQLFNQREVEAAYRSGEGRFFVDWDGIALTDPHSGETLWQSVVLSPLIQNSQVQGVVYVSVNLAKKEFGFSDLNLLSTLTSVMV